MNSKKILGMLAVALLACGACKKKDDKTKSEPAPKVAPEEVAAPDKGTPERDQGGVASTEAVLDHHLQSFGAGKLDDIMADYTDDSVIVTPEGTLKGTEAIKPIFVGMLAEFAKPGAKFNMGKKMIKGDVAYITWDADTADNTYEMATDTFVVKDGKIAYQTFAGKITAKNPPAKAEEKAKADPPADSPTQAVLAHHLGAFGERKIDDILADYTAESVLMSPMGEIVGADNLKPMFEGLFAEFAKPGMKFEMHSMAVEGEVALITWSGETADNTYEWATDTFVIRDGKIAFQTFTAKVTPKG